MNNIILDFRHGYSKGDRLFSEEPAYQYDAGRTLEAYVPESETTFVVEVGNEQDAMMVSIDDVTVTADADGGYKIVAAVPDSVFENHGRMLAYVVVHDGSTVATVYEGAVTIKMRPLSEGRYPAGHPR